MSDVTYDVIIIGAGPAGLGAALYTSRDRLKTLVLEKFQPGGQIINTDRIENYPGIEQIDGPGLIERMQKQGESFGAEIKTGCEVTNLEKLKDGSIAVYCDGDKFSARVVILAPAGRAMHRFSRASKSSPSAEAIPQSKKLCIWPNSPIKLR